MHIVRKHKNDICGVYYQVITLHKQHCSSVLMKETATQALHNYRTTYNT